MDGKKEVWKGIMKSEREEGSLEGKKEVWKGRMKSGREE